MLQYVLITPARNEADYIEQTIKSVIAQTVLPLRWVIVSDGSTDGTDEIVQAYAADHDWLELLRLPVKRERNFAAKVNAFNAGFERVREAPYDVIGNIDADVSFGVDFMEFLIGKFDAMPELGVGGTHYIEGDFHSFRDSHINVHHVNGQCQLFRRACFADIGGYVPIKGGGIDWVAVTTARMKGWFTYSFEERVFRHHRKMGTAATGELGARFHYGKKDYFLGGHPLWQLFRSAYQMGKKPYVVGGMSLFLGYAWCWIRRVERPVSPELIRFHRAEQVTRLRGLFSGTTEPYTARVSYRIDPMSESVQPAYVGAIFDKPTLIKGREETVRCVEVENQVFTIGSGPLRVLRLEDEWFEDLKNPAQVLQLVQAARDVRVDLLSFWQRMPDVIPKYGYYFEHEEIAVLPIESYDRWWKSQIKSRVRNQIRKAEKDGVVVREVPYDDEFVRGMTEIFNEAPVRQGRKFWHYGKDFSTIKRQFSRYLHREFMIGAYLDGRMIGFMMVGDAGRFALTGQIISSLHHREKSPNNALIAKAVELCAGRGLPYLIYLFWGDSTLAEFKRRCGFEPVKIPRYFVPLSRVGTVGLQLGMHRGWTAMMPPGLKRSLKSLRGSWYDLRGH